MRKIFAIFLVTVISLTVNAQTEKSTLLLGGGVGFSSTSFSGGGSSSVFSLSPNIGYFFAENFAVGGMLDFQSGNGYNAWSIAPFVKGYFGKDTKGKPFAQLGVGFGGGSGGGSTSTALQVRGGYALFLNKSIALEIAANFSTQTGYSVFGVGAGFQIHLGK